MSKHSPGPWRLERKVSCRTDDYETSYIYSADPSNKIALMSDEAYYPWCPSNEADWHLIAAAPEMLAVLKQVADDRHACAVMKLRAETVIAKAEGRS